MQDPALGTRPVFIITSEAKRPLHVKLEQRRSEHPVGCHELFKSAASDKHAIVNFIGIAIDAVPYH